MVQGVVHRAMDGLKAIKLHKVRQGDVATEYQHAGQIAVPAIALRAMDGLEAIKLHKR